MRKLVLLTLLLSTPAYAAGDASTRQRLSSRSASACSRKRCARMRGEGDIADATRRGRQGEACGRDPGAIRSLIRSTGRTRMWCRAPAMHISSRKPNVRRRCWSECRGHNPS